MWMQPCLISWNCGAPVAFDTCAEFNRYSRQHKSPGKFMVGPSCNWKFLDHGIATSYAAAAMSAMGTLSAAFKPIMGFRSSVRAHGRVYHVCRDFARSIWRVGLV